ncbi:hypothetical protein TNCV_2748601 [Trichonephila clavipes]|nr:hypothetical protein TNCV_2748601 [Trichonephila clavipes]
MTSRNHLYDSLRSGTVSRLVAGQSQVEMAGGLQEAPNGVSRLPPGRSSKDDREPTPAQDHYLTLAGKTGYSGAENISRERLKKGAGFFSDESRFTRQSDSSRVFNWRESGAPFHRSYLTKRKSTNLVAKESLGWEE